MSPTSSIRSFVWTVSSFWSILVDRVFAFGHATLFLANALAGLFGLAVEGRPKRDQLGLGLCLGLGDNLLRLGLGGELEGLDLLGGRRAAGALQQFHSRRRHDDQQQPAHQHPNLLGPECRQSTHGFHVTISL
ncbi:MAG: hypothetical protein NT031_10200 [Planctomycetota bacterium]|nr:hypothetical protein [Planctomycetota bacterium]